MRIKSKRYTDRQLNFLRSGYLSMKIRDLARAFNKRFGASKTESQIKSTLSNHRIRCGRKGKDKLISYRRLFTEKQERFIRKNISGRRRAKMADLFNAWFKTEITPEQIKTFTGNHGISSGLTGYFPKGHTPWNTGTKGLTGANSGSFKKGSVSFNHKSLFSERVCSRDGFILIKVPEPDPYTDFPTRWKHKHVYIWEQTHGPIPEGMVVAFIDGDKTNCEPENLMLISRAELLNLNRLGYKDTPAELKPHVQALSKLQMKTWGLAKTLTSRR